MKKNQKFKFNISLSILNHLGRGLYRNFITVLGEAISNSWDADANNVCITIDKNKASFIIKDDGVGMTEDDFQNKFLKIGYSKRKESSKSTGDRPYIGRKGIGKLALLSCAEKISVTSKMKDGQYVGGVIDNSELDAAIGNNSTPQDYSLGIIEEAVFGQHKKNHEQGTIIHFEGFNEGIKNRLEYLEKAIALSFQFSLLDKSFNIHLNGKKITHECLKELASETQFLWKINRYTDPYIQMIDPLQKKGIGRDDLVKGLKEKKWLKELEGLKGFVASVEKPSNLTIKGADIRLGIDLFVNGRLRESNILRHISSARIPENYFYGQIHYDALDDGGIDRFTSSREGVVADDPMYKEFLAVLKSNILPVITGDWDKWRTANRDDGDIYNLKTYTKKERKALELWNETAKSISLPKGGLNKSTVDKWLDDMNGAALYNLSAYASCFAIENLMRRYLGEKDISLTDANKKNIKEYRKKELNNKRLASMSIKMRLNNNDLEYLSMDDLVFLEKESRKSDEKNDTLIVYSKAYKPIRNALAHAAVLTKEAKTELESTLNNIIARLKTIISEISLSKK